MAYLLRAIAHGVRHLIRSLRVPRGAPALPRRPAPFIRTVPRAPRLSPFIRTPFSLSPRGVPAANARSGPWASFPSQVPGRSLLGHNSKDYLLALREKVAYDFLKARQTGIVPQAAVERATKLRSGIGVYNSSWARYMRRGELEVSRLLSPPALQVPYHTRFNTVTKYMLGPLDRRVRGDYQFQHYSRANLGYDPVYGTVIKNFSFHPKVSAPGSLGMPSRYIPGKITRQDLPPSFLKYQPVRSWDYRPRPFDWAPPWGSAGYRGKLSSNDLHSQMILDRLRMPYRPWTNQMGITHAARTWRPFYNVLPHPVLIDKRNPRFQFIDWRDYRSQNSIYNRWNIPRNFRRLGRWWDKTKLVNRIKDLRYLGAFGLGTAAAVGIPVYAAGKTYDRTSYHPPSGKKNYYVSGSTNRPRSSSVQKRSNYWQDIGGTRNKRKRNYRGRPRYKNTPRKADPYKHGYTKYI